MKTLIMGVLLVLTLTGCGSEDSRGITEFDRYQQACHDKIGAVSAVSIGWSTVEYRCVNLQGDLPDPLPHFTTG